MTFKLYARANTGSAAVEALFSLSGLPHEIVDVPREAEGSTPGWYRAVNSRAEVPAIGLPDGSVMTESAAIMIHIADIATGAGLAPAIGSPQRPVYLRWMVYLAAAPYTADLRYYYSDRFSTDPAHAPAIKARAVTDYDRDMDYLAANLGPGPFILGASLSAVDLYAAMLMSWAPDFEALMARQPRLKSVYDVVSANPVVRKVWNRNGMP